MFLTADNVTPTLMHVSLDLSSYCSMNQKGKQLSRPLIDVWLCCFAFILREWRKDSAVIHTQKAKNDLAELPLIVS